MYKIRQYITTLEIIKGFFIALLSSMFIYLDYFHFSYALINTILALLALYFLLQSNTKTWFYFGVFMALFWFWWITLSLQHYGYAWALPFGILFVSLVYGFIFWAIAYLSEKIALKFSIAAPFLKALGIFLISYLHPFSFDWYKPELMFVESYLGIEKWQFGIILLAITLTLWKRNFLYLFLVLFAYQPTFQNSTTKTTNLDTIKIVTTHTNVKDKWDSSLHTKQFEALFHTIDQAILDNKKVIILPESVFPLFLNRSQELIDALKKRAKNINIVTGGLYWDGKTPRNSTYIFTKDKITVANKVILVPFGESNPLPDFLSKWVNKVFYDGAIDYIASSNISEYQIDGTTYRNAICFEATSEKLYEGKPKNMIVLSNNGWFTPSIEPTLQKLLLQYYSKKYGTTIYHSVNMSDSYIVENGLVTIKE